MFIGIIHLRAFSSNIRWTLVCLFLGLRNIRLTVFSCTSELISGDGIVRDSNVLHLQQTTQT